MWLLKLIGSAICVWKNYKIRLKMKINGHIRDITLVLLHNFIKNLAWIIIASVGTLLWHKPDIIIVVFGASKISTYLLGNPGSFSFCNKY